MIHRLLSLPSSTLALLCFSALQLDAQVSLIKEDNATNLNNTGSWVVDDGNGIFAPPAVAPINATASPDTWIWNSRVTAANTVNLGNNIGTLHLKITDPAGSVSIGGNNTLSLATGGSIDLSNATVDLTMSNTFTRIGSGGGNYTVKTAAGRKVTFNGTMNARLASAANKAIFEGPGSVVVNGDYQPASCDVTGGTVLFARANGNTVAAGGAFTVSGGTFLVGNTSGAATGAAPVTATGGAVGGTGFINSNITIGSGAVLSPGINGTGMLSTAGLTLDAGSLLAFEFTNPVAFDSTDVTGADGLVINGGMLSVRATGTSDPYAGNGTYKLVRYTGVIGGTGVGALTLDPASQIPGKTYQIGTADGFITLTITAAAGASSFWNVNAAGLWTSGANWTGTIIPNAASASAGFGGGGTAITAPRTVTLNTAQTVGTLSFNSPQSFTLTGTGPLTLDDRGAAASLTNTAGKHTVELPLVLTAGGVVATVAGADDSLTLDGVVSGPTALAKSGPGTLILRADNTYAGGTTIGSGVLQIGDGGTTGSVAGAIANDGVLRMSRSDAALTITQPVSGTGSLVKSGTGTVHLAGPTTFTGESTITAGVLAVDHLQALQGSTLKLDSPGGTVVFGSALATDVSLGGLAGNSSLTLQNADSLPLILTVGANGKDALFAGNLTGPQITKVGTGTQTLAGNTSLSGELVVSSGTLIHQTGNLTLGGGLSTVQAGGGQMRVESGTLSAQAVSTIRAGTRGFVLTGGTADFEGGLATEMGQASDWVILVEGGEFRAPSLAMGRSTLNYSAEPGAGSDDRGFRITGGTAVIAGPLSMGQNNAANSSVSTKVDGGSLRVEGKVTIGLNNVGRWSILDVNGGTFTSTDPVDGVVLGSLALATESQAIFLIREGTASVERVQFGNPGEADIGIVSITGGALYVGSGGMIGADEAEAALGVLRLAGGVIGASASWKSDVPVRLTALAEIRAAGAAGTPSDITLTGPVSDVGGFTKTGSGTLTLSGAASWQGASAVAAGKLILDGDGTASTAPLDVQSGATLGGSGSTGGEVTIQSGATMDPGASGVPGVISVGNLILNGRMLVQANGAAAAPAPGTDRCVASGQITLGAASALEIAAPQAPLTLASYDLLAGTTVTGTFASVIGLPAGYSLSYSAGKVSLVSSSASPYSAWATAKGLTGADAAMNADPDGDSWTNLIEFAINGDPKLADNTTRFRSVTAPLGADNSLTLTLSVPDGAVFAGEGAKSAGINGITLTVEGSDTLINWSGMTISEVTPALSAGLPPPDAGWSYRTFRTPGGTADDTSDYLRVRVTAP